MNLVGPTVMPRPARRSRIALLLGAALGWAAAPPAPLEAQEQPTLSPGMAAGHAVRLYTTREGLPQNSINDILQDRNGFLWLATFGGVTRFDGHQFQVYDAVREPGIPDNRALSLLERSDGEIWMGFQSGGIARTLGEGFEPVEAPPGGLGAVWDLGEDSAGGVWVASDRGLSRYDPQLGPAWIHWGEEAQERSLLVQDSMVWSIGFRGVLRGWGLSGALLVEDSLPVAESTPTLAQAPGGGLWIGSGSTLHFRSPEGWYDSVPTSKPVVRALGAGFTLVGGTEVRILRGTPGAPGELRRLIEGGTPVFSGPLASVSSAALPDVQAGFWVGTRGGGLLHVLPQPLDRIREAAGVDLTGTMGRIVRDPEGALWLAAGCAGVLRSPDGRTWELVLEVGEELPSWMCPTDVVPEGDSVLWISTQNPDQRVYRVRPGEAPVPIPGTTREGRLAACADGEPIWIPPGRRPLRLTPGGAEPYPLFRNLPTGGMGLAPLPAGDSSLWVGVGGELFRLDLRGEILSRYALPGVQAPIRTMARTPDGSLWAGTYGGGVILARGPGDVRRITTAQGLADNFLADIVADEEGNLWFMGNRNLSYVAAGHARDFAEGRADRLLPVILNEGDGFYETAGPGGARMPGGTLLFPTLDGLLRVEPARVLQGGEPSAPVVEAILADGTPLPGDQPRVPAAARRLEISFSAADFRRPESLRFRYRLLGFDDAWTYAGTDRVASFTDVPPGSYVFQVDVVAPGRGWRNEPGRADLTVEPFFWETTWFGVLAVLAVVGLVAGIIQWRTREVQARARELQAEVDQRRVAEAARDQAEERLRQAAKLEAVGRLTGGVAHDFNNLLTVVQGNLEMAREEAAGQPMLEEYVNQAMAASGRGAALTRKLLAFARKTNLEVRPVDPRAMITEMIPLLRRALGETIELKLEPERDLWTCLADPSQLENAILNLVINARDAMPDGGSVAITLRNCTLTPPLPDHLVQVDESGEGGDTPEVHHRDFVRISVRDTGTGIEPELVSRIFDPFFTTKETGKGSGLGLSMVFGMVHQAGGRLGLETAPGRGTTIHLYIPRARNA